MRGLCLFGSRARGEAAPDSDANVAVVLARVDSVFEQIHHMGGIGSRISPQLDVNVSRIPVDVKGLTADASLFLRNVAREGVAVP